MTQAHIDGIIALLEAVPGLTVYDTEAETSPTFPYVVVAAPSLAQVSTTWDDEPRDVDDYVTITGAGTGPAQARWALDKAFGALDRKSPIVDGYSTRIHRAATGPIGPDRDVTLTSTGRVIYGADTYRYRATPA